MDALEQGLDVLRLVVHRHHQRKPVWRQVGRNLGACRRQWDLVMDWVMDEWIP